MKKLIALGLLLTLTLTSCLPGLEYSIDLGKKGRSNGSVESNFIESNEYRYYGKCRLPLRFQPTKFSKQRKNKLCASKIANT